MSPSLWIGNRNPDQMTFSFTCLFESTEIEDTMDSKMICDTLIHDPNILGSHPQTTCNRGRIGVC